MSLHVCCFCAFVYSPCFSACGSQQHWERPRQWQSMRVGKESEMWDGKVCAQRADNAPHWLNIPFVRQWQQRNNRRKLWNLCHAQAHEVILPQAHCFSEREHETALIYIFTVFWGQHSSCVLQRLSSMPDLTTVFLFVKCLDCKCGCLSRGHSNLSTDCCQKCCASFTAMLHAQVMVEQPISWSSKSSCSSCDFATARRC